MHSIIAGTPEGKAGLDTLMGVTRRPYAPACGGDETSLNSGAHVEQETRGRCKSLLATIPSRLMAPFLDMDIGAPKNGEERA